jgi:dTDP-4-amino-4,6-dideoxygalactose transaminase
MLDLRAEYEFMKEDIDAALRRCIEHQKWILGPEVKELEEKIADYIGTRHCIGMSSGTDALVLSLRALAIKRKGEEYFSRDDLIITTPFTFTATGDAILRSGATPVFVDIDQSTYNIDPDLIKKFLTSTSTLTSSVVGILPVHLYGQSCDMDSILEIADEYNLFVIEDVAQAFGGSTGSPQRVGSTGSPQRVGSTGSPQRVGSTGSPRKLGSIGTAGAFSFFPSKNLGGFGDGGMVSTNDSEIAELIRMLLKHGGKDKYNVDHIGYNARLDTLQAAVLLAKLKYVDEFNSRRRKIAEMYNFGLKDVDDIALPVNCRLSTVNDSYHVYHQYTISCSRRDELQTSLKEKGISTMVYYPFPLHKMNVFRGRSHIASSTVNAEQACENVLSLFQKH